MLWWYNSMVGSMFFFKQKTAYELRISDWSSDVCSSDLLGAMFAGYLFHDGFIGHHWKAFWGEAILVLDDHKALENMHHVPFLVMIAPLVVGLVRSEERRVGKACVRRCSSGWAPSHSSNNQDSTKLYLHYYISIIN